ncbi:MFS general substrate transporter [Melanogaster broomeanus]|nr:MFS general substrate transporter [Melanogaster broomeanus]
MSPTLETVAGAPPQDELESAHCDREEPLERTVPPALTQEQETKLWRKIDWRIIPTIAVMFLFSFTDRGAIGNAKIEGMTTQLDLTGNRYNMALTMFFIPYCVFELPATLTMWYPRFKLQYRIALFAGAAGLAGAFSGFLSFAMDSMNGVRGLQAWSWIFIIYGIATIVFAFIAAFVMVDYPSTAKFLTDDERSFVIETQARDAVIGEDLHGVAKQVWAGITDWQVWALSVVYFSIAAPGYALVYFLPTIINDFGYSPSITQLLTIPPYLLAVVGLLMFAHFSDKLHLRSPFIFAGQSISLVGFIINISDAPSSVKYFGLCLCLVGSSAGIGVVSWLANNLRGKCKRSAGMALQVTSGGVGGAIASNIFRSRDAPRYIFGIGLEIIFIGTGLVAILVTAVTYRRINAARDHEELLQQQGGEKGEIKEGGGGKRIGDRALSFRYTI